MDPLVIGLGAVLVLGIGVVGYLVGRRSVFPPRDSGAEIARRLDEYEFYPFVVDPAGNVGFSADAFNEAVEYFARERNERAARELIVIGEQNLVRDTFPSDRLNSYREFYAAYDGDAVVRDNDAFLENYRRIVNQIGRSVPNTGIEILLHNLVNSSRSLVAIENSAVTGRSVGSGATNLVLDLPPRLEQTPVTLTRTADSGASDSLQPETGPTEVGFSVASIGQGEPGITSGLSLAASSASPEVDRVQLWTQSATMTKIKM